jgi:hypothetical protein
MQGLIALVRTHNLQESPEPLLRVALGTRADELTTALSQWRAAREVARVRSGELDAWKHADGLLAEDQELRAQIAATPAKTVAGMMAKLALVESDFADEDLSRCGGSAEDILASGAVDFNTLKPALAAG